MVQVERIDEAKLKQLFVSMGLPAADAKLLWESGRTDWVLLTGVTSSLPSRLHAALMGEGLLRYEVPSQKMILIGASRGSWRALLARFPDAADWVGIGRQMADALALPFVLRAATQIGGREWCWGERTYVMGILNVTPDSFSDGGRYMMRDAALARAEWMLQHGADLIDVGGESTRPGADPVPASEERKRVVPVIEELVKRFGAIVSIDTYKASVAKAAVEAGAALVNDVTGFQGDPSMAETVAHLGVPVVIQHILGKPKDMQRNPKYVSVVPEVTAGLQNAVERALQAGIEPENIIIDPGFGFGKRLEHNLVLLQRLGDLRTLGYPVLAGTSRKTMIGEVLGLPVTERVEGTAATVALAVAARADIVRVHDVDVMQRVVRMSDAVVRRTLLVQR